MYNPSVKGTFTAENEVVIEFQNRHFHWGHNMTEKYDNHHFEKAGLRKTKVRIDSLQQDTLQ